jgi:hypothetical protein
MQEMIVVQCSGVKFHTQHMSAYPGRMVDQADRRSAAAADVRQLELSEQNYSTLQACLNNG